MSMLRNVLTYMGLGPDEDYDDGYLYDSPEDRSAAPRPTTAEMDDDLRTGDDARPGDRRSSRSRVTSRANRDRSGGGRSDDGISVEPDPDPHAPRERPAWLAGDGGTGDAGAASDADLSPPDDGDDTSDDGVDQGPAARPGSGLRAELRSRVAATRPLRAVPPAALTFPETGVGAAVSQGPAARVPAAQVPADLVQPENGITVRAVVAEADMAVDTSAADPRMSAPRQVRPRLLSPQSFGEAKILADEFKADVPVVMNLQGIERDLARRLIDFASGICYALDGSMEKLAVQVFLLTPRSVEVSDDDRRRLQQRGYDR